MKQTAAPLGGLFGPAKAGLRVLFAFKKGVGVGAVQASKGVEVGKDSLQRALRGGVWPGHGEWEKQEARLLAGEGGLMPAFGWAVQVLGQEVTRLQLHRCPLRLQPPLQVAWPAGSS